MAVIEVERVSKTFGDKKAVDNISFDVEKGRIFGLLGPNGAGKTTTLRMINHILEPDLGRIRIDGRQASPYTQTLIGYLPEERGLYKKMKVGEQLIYLAQLKDLSYDEASKAVRYWLDRFNAGDWFDMEIGELSKGMTQKVQFIATIAHDPMIYIFDEPFTGLDPINSELLKEIILELHKDHKTIIFSTHRMEQIEQLCDDICLMNEGQAILKGNLQDIKQSYGENTVLLEFSGSPEFLNQLEGVRLNNRSTNFAEIRLLDGARDQDVLHTALQHVEVQRFERVEPSLTDIFISEVGEENINPKELT